MSQVTEPAPPPSDARRAVQQRMWRIVGDVVRAWTNTDAAVPDARHAIRTARLRATWPRLADVLDAMASNSAIVHGGARPFCPNLGCGVPVDAVKARPNPRTADHTFTLWPCGDEVTREQALTAWDGGADVDVTPINGATLGAAERARQVSEEGYTLDHDLEHGSGDLSWAAWCLLDRASHDVTARDDDAPPAMWPWSEEAWATMSDASRLRLLIKTIALIEAEVDASLHRGERP